MAGFYKEILANNGAFKFYIDGKWKESDSGVYVDIINPFTLQKQYKIQGKYHGPLSCVSVAICTTINSRDMMARSLHS